MNLPLGTEAHLSIEPSLCQLFPEIERWCKIRSFFDKILRIVWPTYLQYGAALTNKEKDTLQVSAPTLPTKYSLILLQFSHFDRAFETNNSSSKACLTSFTIKSKIFHFGSVELARLTIGHWPKATPSISLVVKCFVSLNHFRPWLRSRWVNWRPQQMHNSWIFSWKEVVGT